MSEGGCQSPGSLWILNGGKNGWYRVVVRQSGVCLGMCAAWRDAVLLAARSISPELADLVTYWSRQPGEVGKVLIRGLHVFVLGCVVWEGRCHRYSVESEHEAGCYYRVDCSRHDGLWRCSCPEYEFSGCHGALFIVWGRRQLVCKHILGVWFTHLYSGFEEGIDYGMAISECGADGDRSHRGRSVARTADALGG